MCRVRLCYEVAFFGGSSCNLSKKGGALGSCYHWNCFFNSIFLLPLLCLSALISISFQFYWYIDHSSTTFIAPSTRYLSFGNPFVTSLLLMTFHCFGSQSSLWFSCDPGSWSSLRKCWNYKIAFDRCARYLLLLKDIIAWWLGAFRADSCSYSCFEE